MFPRNRERFGNPSSAKRAVLKISDWDTIRQKKIFSGEAIVCVNVESVASEDTSASLIAHPTSRPVFDAIGPFQGNICKRRCEEISEIDPAQ
jgi:hypothetical protein